MRFARLRTAVARALLKPGADAALVFRYGSLIGASPSQARAIVREWARLPRDERQASLRRMVAEMRAAELEAREHASRVSAAVERAAEEEQG